MKKTLFLLLAVVAVSLFSCGGSTNDPTDNTPHLWAVTVTSTYRPTTTQSGAIYDPYGATFNTTNPADTVQSTTWEVDGVNITSTAKELDSKVIEYYKVNVDYRYDYKPILLNTVEIVYNQTYHVSKRIRTYKATIIK